MTQELKKAILHTKLADAMKRKAAEDMARYNVELQKQRTGDHKDPKNPRNRRLGNLD